MLDESADEKRQRQLEQLIRLLDAVQARLDRLDHEQASSVGAAPGRGIIGVRTTKQASHIELWVNLLGFVVLQGAIATGWVAATGGHLNDSWKTLVIALASAALGFGVAHLLGRRSADSRGRELERDYENLKERSRRVWGAAEKLERTSRPSESEVSSGPAQ
jgi:hypothetical protein